MNDILDDLRRILPSDEVEEQRINRNRSVLLQELSRRPTPRGRFALRVGLVATAGVATVGTVTVLALNPMQNPAPALIAVTTAPPEVTQAPTSTPVAEPTATAEPTSEPVPEPPTVASVLAQVAAAAASTTVPATGYLRVDEVGTYLWTIGHTADGQSLGDLAEPEDVDVAVRDAYPTALYIPLDGSAGEWAQETTGAVTREGVWGRTDRAYAVPNLPIGQVSPLRENWLDYLIPQADFASLPRDPRALLDVLQQEHGSDAGWVILHTLRLSYAPADLQAALFGAAQLLPDAELLAADAGTAVIEWSSPEGRRFRLTINSATSRVTEADWWGGRGTLLDIPDDVPDIRWTMSFSYVDSAPDIAY